MTVALGLKARLRHALGIEIGRAGAIAIALAAAAHAAIQRIGAERTALGLGGERRRTLTARSNNVHHAADGLRAKQGALRTAQHLDAVDTRGEQVAEIE